MAPEIGTSSPPSSVPETNLLPTFSPPRAWFNELRKKRMEDLRRALELSEDSIGSLESKLESLKAEKWDDCHVGYGSSRTESPVPFQKSGVESSGKEISKDGLSAGSFTQETHTNWSAECQIPGVMPTEEVETRPETSESSEQEKVSGMKKLAETLYGGRGGGVRKRRGKRKRKECSRDVNEVSVGESEFLCLADVLTPSRCKENSISNSGEVAGSSGADNRSLGKDGIDVLMEIYNSLLENKSASVFRRRLDSQKRGRYKKMIRRHMDFDTIRSRIASHSITSVLELFRDLLLLTNNSLVFYSKNTREYKSAQLLRDLISQKLRQHSRDSSSKATTANHSIETPMPNRTVKPRSARPANNKVPGKVANTRNVATKTSSGGKRPSIADFPSSVEYLAVTNKGFGRSKKGVRGSASQEPVAPMNGRKRVQASKSIARDTRRMKNLQSSPVWCWPKIL